MKSPGSNEPYRKIVEGSKDAILVMDGATILYANKAALNMYGADSPEEMVGKSLSELGLIFPAENASQSGHGNVNLNGYQEFPARIKDGTRKIFEVSRSNVEFRGKPAELGIIRDITSSKSDERRRKALYNNVTTLMKASTESDVANRFLDSVRNVMGLDFVSLGFVDRDEVQFRHSRGEGLLSKVSLNGKGVIVRAVKTGKTQYIPDLSLDTDPSDTGVRENSASSELIVPLSVGDKVVAVIDAVIDKPQGFSQRDIELIEAQSLLVASAFERLREKEKDSDVQEDMLELVGGFDKMCYRIQSDLRGPLNSIENTVYLLRHNPEMSEQLIDSIDHSLELVMNTLDGVKEVTNPTESDRSFADVVALIEQVLSSSGIPDDIEVVKEYSTMFLALNIDREKIRRTLFNLVRNAVESMPDGGKVTIGITANEYDVAITIADTGYGIHAEDMKDIYRPFYTTKPRRVGLGLSFSKLAVEANGGSIDVWSEAGKGTTVTMTLPR